MFPALYQEGGTPTLSEDQLIAFYEKGLRPAVVDALGYRGDELPPNYPSAFFRAQGHNKKLAFQSFEIPSWSIAEFGSDLRRHLSAADVDWAADFKFIHQLRGTKNQQPHGVGGEDATAALEEFLDANDLIQHELEDDEDEWYIDVGLEISSADGECIAIRTDAHGPLYENIARVDTASATRITSVGSSKYYRDPTSHLTAASGCRCEPGSRAWGYFHILYFQMYLTDKAITYRPDSGHFGKFLSGKDIIDGTEARYLEGIYQLYKAASTSIASSARIEVRVPLRFGDQVLLDLDLDLLRTSLLHFPRDDWW